MGAEEVSLAVQYKEANKFATSGYSDLQTNETYIGGRTRQYGRYSFSRIFQAGHMVPAYQPETAYQVFMRATTGRDIATGRLVPDDTYSTNGTRTTEYMNMTSPEMPESDCYVLDPATCNDDQWLAIQDGTANITEFFFVNISNSSPETSSNDNGASRLISSTQSSSGGTELVTSTITTTRPRSATNASVENTASSSQDRFASHAISLGPGKKSKLARLCYVVLWLLLL